jgi:type I restriction enzyme S subunit
VIGRSGSLGGGQFISSDFWPLNTTLWVKDFKGNDKRFCYYLLKSLDLGRLNAGSGVPTLNRNHIHPLKVKFPTELDEQRAIARILGTLDDKIELNRRMNETLEAMAQALFKSWFVDFDPVVVNAIKAGNPIPEKFAARAAHYRDNPDALGLPDDILRLFPARFVDSELGPIPEGWEVKHLADAIEIHDSKRIPLNSRERAARQGPYPYYGATGIVDYVDDYLFDGIYVLVGEDGSVIDEKGHPVTQYVWGQFWVNNHAHVLTGDGISNEHLYLILKNTNIRAFVTGAVQPKISQKNLKVIPFVHSGENISRVFASQIAEYFRKIRSINEESRTLADLRDTLLPKLISGELRVPDVEKIMEDG